MCYANFHAIICFADFSVFVGCVRHVNVANKRTGTTNRELKQQQHQQEQREQRPVFHYASVAIRNWSMGNQGWDVVEKMTIIVLRIVCACCYVRKHDARWAMVMFIYSSYEIAP